MLTGFLNKRLTPGAGDATPAVNGPDAACEAALRDTASRAAACERTLEALDVQIAEANEVYPRVANRRMSGAITEAQAEAARDHVRHLEAQRVSTRATLATIRFTEMVLTDELQAAQHLRGQLAARDELMPQYFAAVRDLKAALLDARMRTARVMTLSDQVVARCGDRRTGLLGAVGIDAGDLGLALPWHEYFVDLVLHESPLDRWLADVQTRVPDR